MNPKTCCIRATVLERLATSTKEGTARTTRSGTIHVTYSWTIITDAARSALDGTFTGKPFEDASVIVPREPKGSCTHANV